MRLGFTSILPGIVLAAQFAYAADVVYKLDTKGLTGDEPTKKAEPVKLVIVNREWVVPGVEQTSQDLLPPVKFDFAGRPRIEATENCRDFGTRLRYPHTGPDWLEDVAWPLTRELWGSADLGPNMPASPTVIPPMPPRGFHGMNLATGL